MNGSFSEEALSRANELLYGEFPGGAKPSTKGDLAKLKWKVQEDGTVVPAEPEQKPTAPPPKGQAPNAAMVAASNGARNKVGQKKGLAAALAKQTTAGGRAGVQKQLSKLNAGAGNFSEGVLDYKTCEKPNGQQYGVSDDSSCAPPNKPAKKKPTAEENLAKSREMLRSQLAPLMLNLAAAKKASAVGLLSDVLTPRPLASGELEDNLKMVKLLQRQQLLKQKLVGSAAQKGAKKEQERKSKVSKGKN